MVVGGRDPVLHGERLSRPITRGPIGFGRTWTAALRGTPEVGGSNPRPDTSMRFSSQSFILRLSIEGGGEDGRRTRCGDARGCDTLWTVRSAAAATRDRIPDRGISSLSLVLHPDLLGVQQFHGESVREHGLDVRLVLLVVPDRPTGHPYDRHPRLRAASGPRPSPRQLRRDGSIAGDSNRGDGVL